MQLKPDDWIIINRGSGWEYAWYFILRIKTIQNRRFTYEIVLSPTHRNKNVTINTQNYTFKQDTNALLEFKELNYRLPTSDDYKTITNTRDKSPKGFLYTEKKQTCVRFGSLGYKIIRKLTKKQKNEILLELL